MTVTRLAPRLKGLALALIMLSPLGLITRGFDLIDSAYYVFNYRYTFTWPEVNSLTMILSNWLGGLISAALPETGLFLALKLICVGLYALITWFSWLILREHFPARLNLPALALANLYPTTVIYTASYNSFSYLFMSASILLIYRGLERDRPRLLYGAAVLLALNTFVRLPNILQWALIAGPFWYYWFCLGQRRRAVTLTLRFGLSLLLTWLAALGCCRLILGPELFGRQVDGLIDTLFLNRSLHSAFAMWDLYDMIVRESWRLLTKTAPLWGLSLALAWGLSAAGRRWWLAAPPAALGLVAGPALALWGGQIYYVTMFKDVFWGRPLISLTIFLAVTGPALALAGALWQHQRRPLLSALGVMVMVIFLALPFGSDYSTAHYLYYLHLALPVVIGLTHRLWLEGITWLEAVPWLKGFWPACRARELGAALVAANAFLWFLLAGGFRALDTEFMFRAHGDAPNGAATASVAAPALAGLKTHPARAWWLNDLTRQLAPYRDLPLVTLGHCPLCYFLTDAPPLLPDPWLDLQSSPPADLKRGLDGAVRAGRRPLVLMVNQDFAFWSPGWHNYYNENVVKYFMEEQGYTLGLDHLAYKLYLPPGRGQGPPVTFPRRRPRAGRSPGPGAAASAAGEP